MKKQSILIFIGIIVGVSLALTYYSLFTIQEIRTIDADLNVNDYVGLNADTDALHFGTIRPGGSGIRSVHLKNTHSSAIEVNIFVKGDISKLVVFQKKYNIAFNTTKNIAFTAKVPQNAQFRNYSGVAVFVIKKD